MILPKEQRNWKSVSTSWSPEHRQELEVIKNELSKLKADVEAQLLLLQEELDRIEKSLI
jgi:hypothetical protein